MIYPGATWVGGAAAGYARGRNQFRACVLHYTVGIDSTGIGIQGYFNFLVAKDGTVEQFAEADAVTWHAGEANPTGPGIEFERLSGAEPLTADQLAAGGALIAWLIGLGIPDTFHDGDRIPPAAMSGFVTHRSIQQSQPHSDYVTAADWAAMRGGSRAHQEDRMTPGLFLDSATGRVYVYDPNNNTKTWLQTPEALAAWQALAALSGISSATSENDTTRVLLADAVDLRTSIPGDCPDCPPGVDAATARELVAALAKKV